MPQCVVLTGFFRENSVETRKGFQGDSCNRWSSEEGGVYKRVGKTIKEVFRSV